MKFTFKIQQYQTDAVNAVVNVFQGQTKAKAEDLSYLFDPGKLNVLPKDEQNLFLDLLEKQQDIVLGYANAPISLDKAALLKGIQKVQDTYNINQSSEIKAGQGRCSLDVEMETGTGKTYVYIKTMFELNKQYGWNKYIVIVPSVAIREGVKKTFEMTEEHFMEQYGKKARYFIYDSSNLTKIDDFAKSNEINVMIINHQAFAASLNEDKKGAGRGGDKVARIIYGTPDSFGSRRPIDVIAQTNPILILDEPQKLGGKVTQKSMEQFHPLFSINYSATHKTQHNLVYVLDALDAYNQKLVKKIEVKGIEMTNLKGIDSYLYCDKIVLAPNKPPRVRLEFEEMQKNGPKKVIKILEVGTNLFNESKGMNQYQGYVISDINPHGKGCVTFTNGERIEGGDVVGDVSEMDKRRIQIRETILSHFEKEEKLFEQGIKTLSLFFIDEVAKYRQYDEDGNATLGEYGKIFEEEYNKVFNNKLQELFDTPYRRYLEKVASEVSMVHTGYFSVDKKGRSVDSKCERGQDISNDVSAYDLIMKNKEMLLDMNNPVRFIFSHSALREGWDNPNVFQICTLKHSNSEVNKRQEVGRGMRICVNQHGDRMDEQACGSAVHEINKLTVIASESYTDFVSGLQGDIRENLYERPTKASVDYFNGRIVKIEDKTYTIDAAKANAVILYLGMNGYVDYDQKITDKYKADLANGTLAPMPPQLAGDAPAVHKLIQGIFDENILKEMISDGKETQVQDNPLNDNFWKKEFQALWNKINHRYAYKVSFDSGELIKKSVQKLTTDLTVSQIKYTTTKGEQEENLQRHMLEQKSSFKTTRTQTAVLDDHHDSDIKYDLIGEIAGRTTLTRKTVAEILRCMPRAKYMMFRENPEEFIRKVAKIINEQKAALTVDHITYNTTDGTFDNIIFTAENCRQSFDKAFKAQNAIQDYVFTDGSAEKSVERKFAEALDVSDLVAVYAKLPRTFYIPTPMGKYSPDWAIAFKEGSVKHIYFIAETKGTMESNQLRPIEEAKIGCARKLFRKLSNGEVYYDHVNSYEKLMEIVFDKTVDRNNIFSFSKHDRLVSYQESGDVALMAAESREEYGKKK